MPGSPVTGRPFSGPPIAWASPASPFAKASTSAKATVDKTVDKTGDKKAEVEQSTNAASSACRMRLILPSGMAMRRLFAVFDEAEILLWSVSK